ncbi:hypothetical protein ABZ738_05415 [Micromonospora sp. NPDC047793]|uniref:hypothetical protein n=1 Tax=Micromonospora sp. NPDC047793 TaxID=3154342 RepID=UPI0033FD8561
MAKRKATQQDLVNIVAQGAVELAGKSDTGRAAFRRLPATVQGEIHGRAADERQRRADGTTITD